MRGHHATDRHLMALDNRVRRLPGQLDAARRKVAHLEAEARRYGFHDLVGSPDARP